MSTKSTTPRVIHLLKAMTVPTDTAHDGRVAERGEVIEFSERQVEATIDREGRSWLNMTEDDQIRRWGHVAFRPGLIPEGESVNPWDDDPALANILRDQALREASALPTAKERDEAKTAAYAKFGRPVTSQSMGYIPEGKW